MLNTAKPKLCTRLRSPSPQLPAIVGKSELLHSQTPQAARLKKHSYLRTLQPHVSVTVSRVHTSLALVSRLSGNENSFNFTFCTTNLFIANLLKHLRSCQFTG